ncbi:MAG: hypothetical protein JKY65_08350 [Planctomycetes bacterium]|nr:hypothetical protein [Planctomycetota bacterium]
MRFLALALTALMFSGCAAHIGGGIHEGFDDGDNAYYENQSYWGHVADAAFVDHDYEEETLVVYRQH